MKLFKNKINKSILIIGIIIIVFFWFSNGNNIYNFFITFIEDKISELRLKAVYKVSNSKGFQENAESYKTSIPIFIDLNKDYLSCINESSSIEEVVTCGNSFENQAIKAGQKDFKINFFEKWNPEEKEFLVGKITKHINYLNELNNCYDLDKNIDIVNCSVELQDINN